jgi:hypothetical protein
MLEARRAFRQRLELRRASDEAVALFSRPLGSSASETKETLSAPRLQRGRRFGWFYERMVTTGPNYLTCPSFDLLIYQLSDLSLLLLSGLDIRVMRLCKGN